MGFDVQATRFGDLAKVELSELNDVGNPMDNRRWYVNIYIGDVDLEADPIVLPENEMQYCLAELLRQRDLTVAQEDVSGDLSFAISEWLTPHLPE